jgi:hypothetical protein
MSLFSCSLKFSVNYLHMPITIKKFKTIFFGASFLLSVTRWHCRTNPNTKHAITWSSQPWNVYVLVQGLRAFRHNLLVITEMKDRAADSVIGNNEDKNKVARNNNFSLLSRRRHPIPHALQHRKGSPRAQ